MRTKQVRPEKAEYEYEFRITTGENVIQKNKYILFSFRTTKIFESFLYNINVTVKENLSKNEISFNVEGLSAPKIGLEKYGKAKFDYWLTNFNKLPYSITLFRNGKSKVVYKFKVFKNQISFILKPKKSFLNLLIEK